jgi:hypothetical protein
MCRATASRNLGHLRGRLRLLVVATMAVGMVVALPRPGPAGAVTGDDEGLRSLCQEVARRPPTEGIEQTTDPATGAPLQAGQTVNVKLRWEKADFAGSDLERVAHCVVTLDGNVRLDLSGSEAPSANDGEYRGSFVVPAELAPGDCLCVLGVVAGDSPDGGPLRLGGNSCVTVTKPAPPGASPATPAASPATPAAYASERPGTSVLPASQTAPAGSATGVRPGPEPLAELPRTGPFHVRLLLAVAGLALVLGGGAITTRR